MLIVLLRTKVSGKSSRRRRFSKNEIAPRTWLKCPCSKVNSEWMTDLGVRKKLQARNVVTLWRTHRSTVMAIKAEATTTKSKTENLPGRRKEGSGRTTAKTRLQCLMTLNTALQPSGDTPTHMARGQSMGGGVSQRPLSRWSDMPNSLGHQGKHSEWRSLGWLFPGTPCTAACRA